MYNKLLTFRVLISRCFTMQLKLSI